MDNHHFAGKGNAGVTLQIPANDHRACLTEAQFDWPRRTLENRDANPYLKKAALIRGFIDVVTYLQDELRPLADLLESLASQERTEDGE